MRLTNTSGIRTQTVRRVIAFVRPPGIANFDVMVKKSQGTFAGASYHRGSSYHATASPFVVVRIGASDHYPLPPRENVKQVSSQIDVKTGKPISWWTFGAGYLDRPWLRDRVEALVYTMAHELRHQWQAKHPRGWRVWGARGQFSERDADAYAIRKLRAWRQQCAG